MLRLFGISGAIIAIATFPALVGALSPPEEPAAAPAAEPREAAFTVNLEGDDGKDSDHPAYILVRVTGQPDPKRTLLKDKTGRWVAYVEPTETATCTNAKVSVRPAVTPADTGSELWCLGVEDVELGTEMTGTVESAEGSSSPTVLTVTVARRAWKWGWPLVAIGLGLLLGAAVAFVPARLRLLVSDASLDKLYEKNGKEPNETIKGLRRWGEKQEEAGMEAGALVVLLGPIIKKGPKRAAVARSELAKALDESRLDEGNTFRRAAKAQADREDHLITDFVKDQKAREHHLAAEWQAGLILMNEHKQDLEESRARIELLKPACRDEPRAKLAQADVAFDDIESPEEIPRIGSRLNDLRASVENARAKPECRADVDRAEELGIGPPGPREPVPALALVRGWRPAFHAELATLAVITLILIYAALSVYFSTYEPKATFGTFEDYFAIVVAAIGTGAGATVLAILGYWWPEETAEQSS